MIAPLLQIAMLMAAALIVLRSEPALNRMGRSTPVMIRTAFLLLTLGAVAEIASVLAGAVPPISSVITTCGIAFLLACERRLRVLMRPLRRTSQ